MKAIYIKSFVEVGHLKFKKLTLNQLLTWSQNYDEIKVSEVARPQPKDGDVLVQIAASDVNFVDLLYVSLEIL
jgi:hypothetical protein